MNIRIGLLLGALAVASASAEAVELRRATIVPGVLAANIFSGLVAFGAEPDQRFPGCTQRPTRLLLGNSTQVGSFWNSTEEGRRHVLELLLDAKRRGESVTVTYTVAPSGLCYYRGVSY